MFVRPAVACALLAAGSGPSVPAAALHVGRADPPTGGGGGGMWATVYQAAAGLGEEVLSSAQCFADGVRQQADPYWKHTPTGMCTILGQQLAWHLVDQTGFVWDGMAFMIQAEGVDECTPLPTWCQGLEFLGACSQYWVSAMKCKLDDWANVECEQMPRTRIAIADANYENMCPVDDDELENMSTESSMSDMHDSDRELHNSILQASHDRLNAFVPAPPPPPSDGGGGSWLTVYQAAELGKQGLDYAGCFARGFLSYSDPYYAFTPQFQCKGLGKQLARNLPSHAAFKWDGVAFLVQHLDDCMLMPSWCEALSFSGACAKNWVSVGRCKLHQLLDTTTIECEQMPETRLAQADAENEYVCPVEGGTTGQPRADDAEDADDADADIEQVRTPSRLWRMLMSAIGDPSTIM